MTEERINAEDAPRIAERVKFWEEQDRINQELIPRVIRQHELLTGHIADHENLPLVAGNAISEALAEAREEQSQHWQRLKPSGKSKAAARSRFGRGQSRTGRQNRRHEAELAAAKAERGEQDRQYQTSLAACKDKRSRCETWSSESPPGPRHQHRGDSYRYSRLRRGNGMTMQSPSLLPALLELPGGNDGTHQSFREIITSLVSTDRAMYAAEFASGASFGLWYIFNDRSIMGINVPGTGINVDDSLARSYDASPRWLSR